MKMQALVALRDFPYAGKRRKPGDLFQAPSKDARILIALKRAQADPAGEPQEQAAGATETALAALVHETMEIPAEPARRRGRPRRAAEQAE